ncbi:class I SAM-dependent methyltransferase [Pannus brasiliensis CCIBt3594]|uniref:Class I SAM-dependent methyltransferase n=1 Tax=Pannus brasiliensis CCIBt3594 TaxID=1427578 RepID=A0AAW9QZK9_9CHRO
MIDDNNRKLYASGGFVRYYTALSALQPAEETILTLLRERLPGMKMLDLGVGGGRTTAHFAPLVAEYTGLDYSPEMIEACRQRFSGFDRSLSWFVGDARDLSRFEDDSFDFILFSFNGIDYMPPADRERVFAEVARVGKSSGIFCFSSHNLTAIEREFDWKNKIGLNPFSAYVNLIMWAILRLRNRSLTPAKLATSDRAMIRDEPHNFRLLTYYGRPREQSRQLEPFFRDIKIFSWKTGREIESESDLEACTDLWLYYFCTIP